MKIINPIKKTLLNMIKTDKCDITYLSIGSANNVDQQLPQFIIDLIILTKKTARVIIIDPVLETDLSYVCKSSILFEIIIKNGIKIYKSKNIEFVCLNNIINYLDNVEDFNFIKNICLTVINNQGLLFGYDFSGINMFMLQQKIYNNLKEYFGEELSEIFLKCILLDFTYGKMLSCFPDLISDENKPIIIFNNDSKSYEIVNICCYDLITDISYISNKINNLLFDESLKNKLIYRFITKTMYEFTNNKYVEFRNLRIKVNETNNKDYMLYMHNIKNTYKNIFNIINFNLEEDLFLHNITNENMYTCFNKYNKFIFDEINKFKFLDN
jgi:hypothetical protein